MIGSRPLRVLVATMTLVAFLNMPVICLAGPAPPISSVQVVSVASQNEPYWKPIYANTYSTHGEGGGWVLVETFEMGYGQPLYVTLNNLPGTLYAQQPYAPNGVILGWYKVWLFEGHNLNGEFIYDVRSLNSPFNSKTAWLYIE